MLESMLSMLAAAVLAQPGAPQAASGVVFEDQDRDGQRHPAEPGVPGVLVSNGRDVVKTDADGRYELTVDDDDVIFVIKPRDWMTPVNEDQIPVFSYVHKPAGSPAGLRYPGVRPTGPLPESIDFPIHRSPEPDSFSALYFGDTQTYTIEQVDYLARDVIVPILNEGHDARFGITLGDIVGDDLSLLPHVNRAQARLGIPFYPVHGNHDLNFRATSDEFADETWERIYGPTTYAFQHGPVHFLVLDNVIYKGFTGDLDDTIGNYRGGLTDDVLAFVENYLAHVPKDELVVLHMHIPLIGDGVHTTPERDRLSRLLEGRPHHASFSAHTHVHTNMKLTSAEGWHAGEHHHVNLGTASGSWWRGTKDETGIPHTIMRDGTPNGWGVVRFDGHELGVDFRAARRPASEVMNIQVPTELTSVGAAETEVFANVYNAWADSRVRMRVNDGMWIRMERLVIADPAYVALYASQAEQSLPKDQRLLAPHDCQHLWSAFLPDGLRVGTHTLTVEATDAFGKRLTGHTTFRVRRN